MFVSLTLRHVPPLGVEPHAQTLVEVNAHVVAPPVMDVRDGEIKEAPKMLQEDQPKTMEEVPARKDQEPLDQAIEDDVAVVAATSGEVPQGRAGWLIEEDNSEENPNEDVHDISSQGRC